MSIPSNISSGGTPSEIPPSEIPIKGNKPVEGHEKETVSSAGQDTKVSLLQSKIIQLQNRLAEFARMEKMGLMDVLENEERANILAELKDIPEIPSNSKDIEELIDAAWTNKEKLRISENYYTKRVNDATEKIEELLAKVVDPALKMELVGAMKLESYEVWKTEDTKEIKRLLAKMAKTEDPTLKMDLVGAIQKLEGCKVRFNMTREEIDTIEDKIILLQQAWEDAKANEK